MSRYSKITTPLLRLMVLTLIKLQPIMKQALLRFSMLSACSILTVSLFAQNDSIVASFNSTPIAGNNYIWFSSFIKASPHNEGTTIYVNNSHIRFTANSINYNLPVPKVQISFVDKKTLPGEKETYMFNTASQTWIIKMPKDAGENYFAGGLSFKVPASGFPGGISPVIWDAQFGSNAEGLDIDWRWAAAVYTNFTQEYEALNIDIKADNGNIARPRNYINFAVPGATGQGNSGGDLYTGVPSTYKKLYTPVSLKSAAGYTYIALEGTYMDLSNTTLTGNIAICKNGSLRLSSPTTVNGNVYMSTNTTYTLNGILNGNLYLNQDLSQLKTDALDAYNAYRTMLPSATYTTWNNSLTINGTNGLNVISVASVNLSSSQVVTLKGGPNASFVINVSGGFTMGGSAKIIGGGNVNGSRIFINVIGSGSDVTSHINNFIDGTVIAPSRNVSLHNVNGQVIAGGASLEARSGGVNNLVRYNPPKANLAAVGYFMFKDMNLNGKKDNGDTSVVNGQVILFDGLNNALDSMYTDYRGYYFFDSIPVPDTGNASFRVRFTNPLANFAFVNPFAVGGDSTNQSVADPNTGFSSYFTLRPGQIKMTINSGVRPAGSALPIKLGDFTGRFADGFTALTWYTTTEINSSHFEIDRSNDGVNFEKIGQVRAQNNSNNRSTYSFIDLLTKTGINYYRLKLVDIDSRFEYSKVIALNTESKGISLLMIYPNPFGNKVQVKIESDVKEKILLSVVNNSGAIVRSQTEKVVIGDNTIELKNVANLPGGIYYLKVITSARTFSTKIMKQ